MLWKTAVRRLKLLTRVASPVTSLKKLIFLSELAQLGYRLANPDEYNDSLLDHFDELIELLRHERGGHVEYVPLFQGFPERVPDGDRYFLDRLLGCAVNFCDAMTEDSVLSAGTRLDNGLVIPFWLFDLREFGADPITQMQDAALHSRGLKRQKERKRDALVRWIDLRVADTAEVEAACLRFLQGSLYSASSLQETLKADLNLLLEHFNEGLRLDPGRVVFKETRAYLTRYFWLRERYEELALYLQTPTDMLRLFAALTGGDISLAAPIRFPRLTRRRRRRALGYLERCPQLAEDLLRYRGLWLCIARSLHTGEYAKQFPRAHAAFQALRQGDKIATFATQLESALARRALDELLVLLPGRPGVFARSLHFVLELAKERAPEVLAAFSAVLGQVALKNLLVMEAHFRTIQETPYRTIINCKGGIRVMARRPKLLPPDLLKSLAALLRQAILASLAKRPSWAGRRVWVDDAVLNYTVPLQQRKASAGLLRISRGSRLPLGAGKVLRLFVYWKDATQETDLDLSLVSFDQEMSYLGHVSYTRLTGDGIVHSGDIQSAPHGAAEFIDVDLAHLAEESNVRYLAPQIFRYRGDFFASMECLSGWMLRDSVDSSYQSFDIATVAQKFAMTGRSRYCLPILVDIVHREILYIDLFIPGEDGCNNVEGSVGSLSIMTRQMIRCLETRPNLFALIDWNVRARGATLVSDRSQADLTFGVHDCDYNVDDMERILSELL